MNNDQSYSLNQTIPHKCASATLIRLYLPKTLSLEHNVLCWTSKITEFIGNKDCNPIIPEHMASNSNNKSAMHCSTP